MKENKTRICLLLLWLIVGGVNGLWAEEKVSTLTFSEACNGTGTADDGVVWTVTSDAAESTFDKVRGVHFGTGSAAVSYLQLTTSDVVGKIKKIVVNASGASGQTPALLITVGGQNFGSATLSGTAQTYTFTGSAEGEIIVRVSQKSAKKALYVKSIVVTYGEGIDIPVPTHVATFYVDGRVQTASVYEEGAPIVFPTAPANIDGKVFVGWVVSPIDGTTDDQPQLLTSAVMGTSDMSYYAVFATKTAGTQVTTTVDALTPGKTGASSSYGDWSGVTLSSSAVYAGNSIAVSGYIQIRSTNNSGIVSTTSGGVVQKIEVVWNSKTTNGQKLNVYGSNEPYTSASNLYDNSKRGTLLGSITKGQSTTLSITDSYAYVGLRVSSGAVYLSKISITWKSGTPDTYSAYCTSVTSQGMVTELALYDTDMNEVTGGSTIYGTDKMLRAVVASGYDGTIGVSQTNEAIAEISISGTNITLIPKAVGSTTITFTAPATDRFEGEVSKAYSLVVAAPEGKTVKPDVTPTVPQAVIADSGYGTYCCEYPLDFSNQSGHYRAWYVSNVSGTEVAFKQITGKIAGGVPFILCGEPGSYHLPLADESDELLTDNLLIGTLAPTYIETQAGDYTNFGLSKGVFVRMGNGVLQANKAYLPVLTEQVADGSRLGIVFIDVTTDISTLLREKTVEDCYNLGGQRVKKTTGGLYIVKGRKVIVKE